MQLGLNIIITLFKSTYHTLAHHYNLWINILCALTYHIMNMLLTLILIKIPGVASRRMFCDVPTHFRINQSPHPRPVSSSEILPGALVLIQFSGTIWNSLTCSATSSSRQSPLTPVGIDRLINTSATHFSLLCWPVWQWTGRHDWFSRLLPEFKRSSM